jgi:hypothetical protein
MPADVPGMFAVWAGRAHSVIDSELRRKNQTQQQRQETGSTSTAKPPKQKKEWWRLDPNVSDRYRPIEPPDRPDPDVYPTKDRFVFGWEARSTPVEDVIQHEARRLFPNFYKWVVRRAIERAGLKPDHDTRPSVEPPDADIDPGNEPPPEENIQ